MSNLPPPALPRIDGITATIAAGIAMLAAHDPGETSGTGRVPTAPQAAIREALRLFRPLCRIPNSSVRIPYSVATAERCIATVAQASWEDAAELAQMLMSLAVLQEQVREILADETEAEVYAETTSCRLQVWDRQFSEAVRAGFPTGSDGCPGCHSVTPHLPSRR